MTNHNDIKITTNMKNARNIQNASHIKNAMNIKLHINIINTRSSENDMTMKKEDKQYFVDNLLLQMLGEACKHIAIRI